MPRKLISQLAHVELVSPRPQESLDFFSDVLGLSVNGREGQSAYLRAWGEYFHHSLVVTEGGDCRLGHFAWRAAGEEELEIAVGRLEEAGLGEGWQEATVGHGPAFRYRSPGGHQHEIFWEVERYEAPPELASTYPIRPQRFAPVGVGVRQLDHLTLGTPDIGADIEFYCGTFGTRYMECTAMSEDAEPYFAELTNNEQAHDLGLVADPGHSGRSHHFAYWLDQPLEVIRAGDILMEAGVPVEYGPGKHGHGENTYLYVREPGSGHRVEVFSGGYRNYQPDWEPRRWIGGVSEAGGSDMFRNVTTPDSMRALWPIEDSPTEALPEAEAASA